MQSQQWKRKKTVDMHPGLFSGIQIHCSVCQREDYPSIHWKVQRMSNGQNWRKQGSQTRANPTQVLLAVRHHHAAQDPVSLHASGGLYEI